MKDSKEKKELDKRGKIRINKDIIHAISLLGYIGFLFIGSILINIWIYKMIEKYFFKSQILFILMVILGVINGLYSVYKAIMKK